MVVVDSWTDRIGHYGYIVYRRRPSQHIGELIEREAKERRIVHRRFEYVYHRWLTRGRTGRLHQYHDHASDEQVAKR